VRAKELCGIASSDVVLDKHTARGWVKKLGQQRKNWSKRWFVLDIKEKTFKYYHSEKSHKEKNGFDVADLERCFIPVESKVAAGHHKNKLTDKKFVFVVETAQRTFYCQAMTEGAQRIWQALLGSIGDHNELQKQNPGLSYRPHSLTPRKSERGGLSTPSHSAGADAIAAPAPQ
jgi:hypothetical protein